MNEQSIFQTFTHVSPRRRFAWLLPLLLILLVLSFTTAQAQSGNSITVPDTTPPVLSLPADITQNNDAGQCGADVPFNVTATDDSGSATVTAAPASGSFFAVGTTAVAATATDPSGNSAQGSFNVTVNDVEAPVLVTQDITLELEANGEVRLNVFDGALVSQSDNCSTVGSVGVTGPRDYTCNQLGQNTVWIYQDDPSGNEGSASFVLTVTDPLGVCDATPPVISPNISGPQGDNGWYVSDVEVSWTVSDEESAVSSSSGCETTLISSDTAGVTLTCEATSDGGTSSTSVTIQRDATAPTATASVSPTANANGWHNDDVTVTISGSDNLSGIATCGPNTVFNSEGTGFSNSGTCTDNAGNVSTAATEGGINIDKTAPVVSVIGVADGVTYILGDVPTAGCDTLDALSGVATAAILDLSGANPDGSGTITATCAGALDYAGNSGSATVTYTVLTQQEATADILDEIDGLVDDGVLKNGQANGLTRPLDNAIRSLDKGNTAAACSQLTDFIAEVNAKTPSPLDGATAAELIADAQAIQTAIGCP